jgi:hypothetical protein
VVAAGDEGRFLLRALQDETSLGLMPNEPDGLVEKRFVFDEAAHLQAATRG